MKGNGDMIDKQEELKQMALGLIAETDYLVAGRTTLCFLQTIHGFQFVGKSQRLPDVPDEIEIGKKHSFQKAFNELLLCVTFLDRVNNPTEIIQYFHNTDKKSTDDFVWCGT